MLHPRYPSKLSVPHIGRMRESAFAFILLLCAAGFGVTKAKDSFDSVRRVLCHHTTKHSSIHPTKAAKACEAKKTDAQNSIPQNFFFFFF
ncbi:hypothetical protein F4811DRAFT_523311, partial [Daldinia bambusicola]